MTPTTNTPAWQTQLHQRVYSEMQPSLRSWTQNVGIKFNPKLIEEGKRDETSKKVTEWILANCPPSSHQALNECRNGELEKMIKIAIGGIVRIGVQKVRTPIYKQIKSTEETVEFSENDFVDANITTTELGDDAVEISKPLVPESEYERLVEIDTLLGQWYQNPLLYMKQREKNRAPQENKSDDR